MGLSSGLKRYVGPLSSWRSTPGGAFRTQPAPAGTDSRDVEVSAQPSGSAPPFLPPLPPPLPFDLSQSPNCRSRRNFPSGIVQLFRVAIEASALSRVKKLIMPLPLAVPSSFSFTRTPPGAMAPKGEKILSKSWSVVSEGRPDTRMVLSSFSHVPPGRTLCRSNPFHRSVMEHGPPMPIIMPPLAPPLPMPAEKSPFPPPP
mmetsp:Transcript_40099/g.126836  ORF Transcript_40099/g.126836 Transcript_40099/m.126836 type:complete len:201 (+) Transcript_40099:85-687(+)